MAKRRRPRVTSHRDGREVASTGELPFTPSSEAITQYCGDDENFPQHPPGFARRGSRRCPRSNAVARLGRAFAQALQRWARDLLRHVLPAAAQVLRAVRARD